MAKRPEIKRKKDSIVEEVKVHKDLPPPIEKLQDDVESLIPRFAGYIVNLHVIEYAGRIPNIITPELEQTYNSIINDLGKSVSKNLKDAQEKADKAKENQLISSDEHKAYTEEIQKVEQVYAKSIETIDKMKEVDTEQGYTLLKSEVNKRLLVGLLEEEVTGGRRYTKSKQGALLLEHLSSNIDLTKYVCFDNSKPEKNSPEQRRLQAIGDNKDIRETFKTIVKNYEQDLDVLKANDLLQKNISEKIENNPLFEQKRVLAIAKEQAIQKVSMDIISKAKIGSENEVKNITKNIQQYFAKTGTGAEVILGGNIGEKLIKEAKLEGLNQSTKEIISAKLFIAVAQGNVASEKLDSQIIIQGLKNLQSPNGQIDLANKETASKLNDITNNLRGGATKSQDVLIDAFTQLKTKNKITDQKQDEIIRKLQPVLEKLGPEYLDKHKKEIVDLIANDIRKNKSFSFSSNLSINEKKLDGIAAHLEKTHLANSNIEQQQVIDRVLSNKIKNDIPLSKEGIAKGLNEFNSKDSYSSSQLPSNQEMVEMRKSDPSRFDQIVLKATQEDKIARPNKSFIKIQNIDNTKKTVSPQGQASDAADPNFTQPDQNTSKHSENIVKMALENIEEKKYKIKPETREKINNALKPVLKELGPDYLILHEKDIVKEITKNLQQEKSFNFAFNKNLNISEKGIKQVATNIEKTHLASSKDLKQQKEKQITTSIEKINQLKKQGIKKVNEIDTKKTVSLSKFAIDNKKIIDEAKRIRVDIAQSTATSKQTKEGAQKRMNISKNQRSI